MKNYLTKILRKFLVICLALAVIVPIFPNGLVREAIAFHPQDQKIVSPTSSGPGSTLDITFRVSAQATKLPADILLVIDRSGSMSVTIDGEPCSSPACLPDVRIHAAREAAKQFVDKIADPNTGCPPSGGFIGCRIGVLSFAGWVPPWIPAIDDGTCCRITLDQTFTTNYTAVKNALDPLTTHGATGTTIGGGIGTSVLHTLDPNKPYGARHNVRKYMVFLTDGLQTSGPTFYSPINDNVNGFLANGFGASVCPKYEPFHVTLVSGGSIRQCAKDNGVKIFTLGLSSDVTGGGSQFKCGNCTHGGIPDWNGEQYLKSIACYTDRTPPLGPAPVAPRDWIQNCDMDAPFTGGNTRLDPDNYFFAGSASALNTFYQTIANLILQDLIIGLIDQLNTNIFETLPSGGVAVTIVDQNPAAPGLQPLRRVSHGITPCNNPGFSTAIDPPQGWEFDPEYQLNGQRVLRVVFGVIPSHTDYCLTIQVTVKAAAPAGTHQVDSPPIGLPADGPGLQACYIIVANPLTGGLVSPVTECTPAPTTTIITTPCPPSGFDLIFPEGSISTATPTFFSWNTGGTLSPYTLEMNTVNNFVSPPWIKTGISDSFVLYSGLVPPFPPALTLGTTYWWRVKSSNSPECIAGPASFTYSGTAAWFETFDGNVAAKNLIDLTVTPPAGRFNSSYLGIGGGQISNFASDRGWIVETYSWNSGTYPIPRSSYSYFNNQFCPTSGTNCTAWPTNNSLPAVSGIYKFTGNFNCNGGCTPPSQAIVLFVEGDMKIQQNLVGAPAIYIISGDLKIHQNVEKIWGFFIVEGKVETKFQPSASPNCQLRVKGSMIGHGGVDLQRDLAGSTCPGPNETNPAEVITFDPTYLTDAFTQLIGSPQYTWREVAP